MKTDIMKSEDVIDAVVLDPNNLHYARAFEQVIKSLAQEMRRVFNMGDMGYIRFEASAVGRTHGDLKISFKLSTESFGGDVEGDCIQPVMDELLRRNGWEKRHQPKCLTYSGEEISGE